MKVLILGAKGMLGQALAEEFSRAGHEVISWDKEEIDITDKVQLRKRIAEYQPGLVINAAAYNAVDKIEEAVADFELAKEVNGEAVGELAAICRERKIILVHYSTDYVFAGDNAVGCAEDADPNPVNKYGETKARGERLLQENCEKYYLIRLSKLFGKPTVGAGAKKSFVDTMIWLATEGGKTRLDLVNEEKSSPTYAPDLAHLTRELAESGRPFGIYHGANSGACTWYEWAEEIFKIKKIAVTVTPVSGDKFPRPAKRPLFSELLNTKLPLQRDWQAALKACLTKN